MMRSHADILALNTVSLTDIASFCNSRDSGEQLGIARKIREERGMGGLRTLWLCQAMETGPRPKNGCTEATKWWLGETNECIEAMRGDLCGVTNMDDANTLLAFATQNPYISSDLMGESILYFPGLGTPGESLLHATQVRKLARAFFSHIPSMSSPLNPLYFNYYEAVVSEDDGVSEWDPIYRNPYEAFMDDANALKYLALAHQRLPRNAPEWLKDFHARGDDEWNMYQSMGLDHAASYQMAEQKKEQMPLPPLALPSNFDIESSM